MAREDCSPTAAYAMIQEHGEDPIDQGLIGVGQQQVGPRQGDTVTRPQGLDQAYGLTGRGHVMRANQMNARHHGPQGGSQATGQTMIRVHPQ